MFLLSNCKYWMEEFRLDGFGFDGVTSMIYLDHGLGRDLQITLYFGSSQDEDALGLSGTCQSAYQEINPDALPLPRR